MPDLTESTLHGLLIGIDCYLPNQLPDGGYYPSLGGCVRDVKHVEAFLISHLGLANDRIVKLTASNTRNGTPNFTTKTICAQVLSFSPFVIASVLDQTPPLIVNVSANPSAIWPPDHKMIDVTVNYDVSDEFTSESDIVCSLEVSSNEPVNTTGDGNTAPDIEIVDAHHVRLRAERSGTGNGRDYTITIVCKDSAQNISKATVIVSVPKSQN